MRHTRTWYHSRQLDNLYVFIILVALCYVLIHIITDASTLSTANWNIQTTLRDRNSAECHIPSYGYIALLSASLSEQHPCQVAWAPAYPLLLSSQDSVDADVGQALVPASIFAREGTHGCYGTWPLMMSGEGFPAAQNVHWWLPSDESAAISMYLVCHPLHPCTCILVLLLLRLICQRV